MRANREVGVVNWGTAPARRLPLPRLTPAVFTDLKIWMVGLGLFAGVVFPFFVLVLGIPAGEALTMKFFAATLAAGLLVGGLNFLVARGVVGARLRALSGGMHVVAELVRQATQTGDWSGCNDQSCILPVDSRDELGESAAAFNQLVEALRRSHATEAAIQDLLMVLSEDLELGRLTNHALLCLLEHCEADAGAMLVFVGPTPRVTASSGFRGASSIARSPAIRSAMMIAARSRVRRPRKVMIETRHAAAIDTLEVVPISFRANTLGAVVLASARQFDGERGRLLELFRGACGVAINHALVHASSRRLALVDPLTSCVNRRHGQQLIDRELSRAARLGRTVGVLMIDLDHFKAVNDEHGHLTGDELLRRAAQAARRCLRSADVLVRYGGEEFLAVLPGVDATTLGQVAERIRRAISSEAIDANGRPISVTTSVGGALSPGGAAADSERVLREADAALYEAKRQGRDRVVLAAPSSPRVCQIEHDRVGLGDVGMEVGIALQAPEPDQQEPEDALMGDDRDPLGGL